jgi:ABC-type glycerol-3-phosphate transport system substrate-binding protein
MAFGLLASPAFAWSYKEAAEPYKGTTLKVLDETTPLQDHFSKLIPEFEKETGIKVEYELLNHFEVIAKGQADLLTGKGDYDIIMNHSVQQGLLLDAGVIMPLDDLLANATLTNPDLDLPDLIEPAYSTYAKHKGKTYGFLNWNYNLVYWARNDLLTHADETAAFKAKYGYDLAPAKTFKQVRDIAEFFTRKKGATMAGETLDSDYYGIVIEGLNGGTTYQTVWYIYIRNHGGDLFDANGVPTANTPEVITALTKWAELWKFSPPGQAEYSLIDVPTVMGNGIAAQSIAWADFVVGIDLPGKSKLAGKFTYARTPTLENASVYHSAGEPSAMQISTHTKNAEAAYLFLQWSIDKATQDKLLMIGPGEPIRNSDFASDTITKSRHSVLYEAMAGSLKGVRAAPKMPKFLEITDTVNRVIQQVGIGQLTPEEGAATLQKDLEALCNPCM